MNEYEDYENNFLIGQISELFSSPAIPKIVFVGLSEIIGNDNKDEETIKIFKEILTRVLDNLFIIEFLEQVRDVKKFKNSKS